MAENIITEKMIARSIAEIYGAKIERERVTMENQREILSVNEMLDTLKSKWQDIDNDSHHHNPHGDNCSGICCNYLKTRERANLEYKSSLKNPDAHLGAECE